MVKHCFGALMDLETFIDRWTARRGRRERANYQMFLSELCDVIGVKRPDPSGGDTRFNDYVLRARCPSARSDGGTAPKRIDLYRNDSYWRRSNLRFPGEKKAIPGAAFFARRGARKARPAQRRARLGCDDAERSQAGGDLCVSARHRSSRTTFIITCDVGHALEIYADFTGTGHAYNQFQIAKAFGSISKICVNRPFANGWRKSGRNRIPSIPRRNPRA